MSRFLAIAVALAACSGGTSQTEPTALPAAATAAAPATTAVPTTTAPATSAPATGLPEGWESYTVDEAGFRIAAPARWAPITLEPETIADLLGEVDLDPEIGALIEAATTTDAFAFVAIDVVTGDNVNVQALASTPQDTLDNIESVAATFLEEGFGAVVLDVTRLDIAGVAGLRISYEAELVAGQPFRGFQYYAPIDGILYITTVTLFPPYDDLEVADLLIASFGLLA